MCKIHLEGWTARGSAPDSSRSCGCEEGQCSVFADQILNESGARDGEESDDVGGDPIRTKGADDNERDAEDDAEEEALWKEEVG